LCFSLSENRSPLGYPFRVLDSGFGYRFGIVRCDEEVE
jgi:hypothetical protein